VVGLIIAALGGAGIAILVASFLIDNGSKLVTSILPFLLDPRLEDYLKGAGLFKGYVRIDGSHDPRLDHIRAFAAFISTIVLYVIVGAYGWFQLGKKRTVPALGSALMLMLMLGWMLSGVTFFFDAWRIPTLLIVAVVGAITAQSNHSDHFYNLRERDSLRPAPNPAETITASKQSRVIVVAANGGGIQAGAWAAQVLFGLYEDCPEKFQKSLRMISSVSGGSVGNACFVNWLADANAARRPDESAAGSSLDEVAWG